MKHHEVVIDFSWRGMARLAHRLIHRKGHGWSDDRLEVLNQGQRQDELLKRRINSPTS